LRGGFPQWWMRLAGSNADDQQHSSSDAGKIQLPANCGGNY
jgi:hypothetical protein